MGGGLAPEFEDAEADQAGENQAAEKCEESAQSGHSSVDEPAARVRIDPQREKAAVGEDAGEGAVEEEGEESAGEAKSVADAL